MKPELALTLQRMRDELESSGLVVGLAPAPRPMHSGHCVRVVCDRNPLWYRRLCAAYLSTRRRCRAKVDTAIKRRNVLRGIDAMLAGRMPPANGPRILEAARRYWKNHRADLLNELEALNRQPHAA